MKQSRMRARAVVVAMPTTTTARMAMEARGRMMVVKGSSSLRKAMRREMEFESCEKLAEAYEVPVMATREYYINYVFHTCGITRRRGDIFHMGGLVAVSGQHARISLITRVNAKF